MQNTAVAHRQTHTKALIFAFITLLVVSTGCKKEIKLPPIAPDATTLAGTNWVSTDGYDFGKNEYYSLSFFTDTCNGSLFFGRLPNEYQFYFYKNGVGKIYYINTGDAGITAQSLINQFKQLNIEDILKTPSDCNISYWTLTDNIDKNFLMATFTIIDNTLVLKQEENTHLIWEKETYTFKRQ